MRKSLLTVSGALLLPLVLSGCAAGVAGALLNSGLFIGAMSLGADANADRCYEVETKILKYAPKGTPRYKRDMTKEDCAT
jgi:hypothetical protein